MGVFFKKKFQQDNYDYTVALVGNPNVGKSTIFNALTGMRQHTGNWAGKTVEDSSSFFTYNDKNFKIIDLPGTYSLFATSAEEEVTKNYIVNTNPNCVVVVADATCLERNLNLVFQVLEISRNVILCVNLLDEAEKKGIKIDIDKLSEKLGISVIGTSAKNKKTLVNLVEEINKISLKSEVEVKFENPQDSLKKNLVDEKMISNKIKEAQNISKEVITYTKKDYNARNKKIDKILTSKTFGIPIMLRIFRNYFLVNNSICKLSISNVV